MTIYDESGAETEKIELHKVDNRDSLHKLFQEKGFVKKAEEDLRRMKEEKEEAEKERLRLYEERREKLKELRERRGLEYAQRRHGLPLAGGVEAKQEQDQMFDFNLASASPRIIVFQRLLVFVSLVLGVLFVLGLRKKRRRTAGPTTANKSKASKTTTPAIASV